jgi:hypothetical protein
MKKRINKKLITALCMLVTLLLSQLCLSGCDRGTDDGGGSGGSSGGSTSSRTTVTDFKMPEASGTTVFQNADGTLIMDASHTESGYVLVKYTGSSDKIQVQVTDPSGVRTPYPVEIGDYEVVSFVKGNGTYQVDCLEHISGTSYAVGISETLDVQLTDEFQPFLYPNQYSDYKADSACVKKGMEISDDSSDDIDYITNVYHYVTENITYDEAFAANIPANYIPNPDATMSSGKGICLDYASVTLAMLRSQGIPTKLEVGYPGQAYHAWISVWTEETGWIDKVIQFNGDEWTLVDPTLGANQNNDDDSLRQYIGDGSNYTLQFEY